MKRPINLAVALASLACAAFHLQAQTTAFTYQGRLKDGGGAVTGIYDLRFMICDSGGGPAVVAGPLTNSPTSVTNGLFAVTLDFGSGIFTGADRWLEIALRTNGGHDFTTLLPRQALTPAPYAVYAANAGSAARAATAASAGSVSASNIAGTLATAQLPASVLTNCAAGVNLSGAFSGGFGGLTNFNMSIASFGSGVNRLRFNDAPGSQQVFLHAGRNMDLETVNDATFWAGHDFTAAIDHDASVHMKHDALLTVDNNLSTTIGASLSLSVGANTAVTVGNNLNIAVGNSAAIFAGGGLGINKSTPAAALDVGGTVAAAGLMVSGSGGFSSPQLFLQQLNPNDYSRLRFQSGGPAWDIALAPGAQPALNFWNGSADILGLAQNGDATLQGSLRFGTGALRQMLDLWVGQHGIGVQGWTTYFRTIGAPANGGFAWYKGGAHADGQFDPGGGEELMRLNSGGLAVRGTFVSGSDRNSKSHFAPINPRAVLDKVAALPLSTWNYKDDPNTPHLGPMAQDFHAAFGVGSDDKHIATVDADGVALAAIQGLNQKVEEKESRLQEWNRKLELETASLRAQNTELKQRIERLEQLVNAQNRSGR